MSGYELNETNGGLYGSVLSGYTRSKDIISRLRATDPRSGRSKRCPEMEYFGVLDLMVSRIRPPKWSDLRPPKYQIFSIEMI